MQHVRAKKSLGQHFLADRNIARKIVASLLPGNFSSLIEIGPGMGVLTGMLFENYRENFTAIEIDRESVAYLKTNFPQFSDRVIQHDFLEYPIENHGASLALIGNLPYFISSQVFFRVLEYRHLVNQMVCMIQKEVAERIAAGPGSKTYGILSVLLQAFYRIEYLFTVNEKCFVPPPKVKSAVIRLMRNTENEPGCDFEMFRKVVKGSFNQRRKVIRNSLKDLFQNLPEGSDLLMKRPEELSVTQFEELTKAIAGLNP